MDLFLRMFSFKMTSRLGGHLVCLLSSARWPGPLWAWLLLVMWAGLVRPSAQAQPSTIRYVSPKGAGSQTGTNWENALPGTSLQAAINASSAGDQVWVAGGVYKPTTGTDRTVSFAMKAGVALYGGFIGTETNLDQRSPINPGTGSVSSGTAQPSSSTLSGDIGRAGDNADNSYHVIYNSPGLTHTAVLDGFVITGGYGNGTNNNNDSGGGMYNNGSGAGRVCSPLIRYCTFVANSVTGIGGAMVNDGSAKGTSSPALTNCAFVQDTSAYLGGAIYNTGQNGTSSPTLINCAFMANVASNYGGAVVNEGTEGVSSPNLINCTFLANSTLDVGGAMYNTGYNGTTNPRLTNCVLFGNGGENTFYNTNGGTVSASYSLFDNTVRDYADGGNNRTTTTSPFTSLTSVALNACGPAIDAGSNQAYTDAGGPPTDLLGNPRVYPTGGRIDIGAVESQDPILFTQQPASASAVNVGDRVEVPVRVTGSVSAYQWYKDGQAFNGQTSATLSLTNVQTTDEGRYSVEVTGSCNSLTSTAFNLTVIRLISIAGLSASPNPVVEGQFITFSAKMDNLSGPYSYTLANGLGSTLTGRASSAAFSQTVRARGSGPQTYTLMVATEDGHGSTTVDLTVTPGPAVANGPACTDFTNRTTANAGFGSSIISGVYAQGNTVYVATNSGLSVSYDGGTSFNITNANPYGSSSDPINGVFAQGDTVYAATAGGLSISPDRGKSFVSTGNYNLGFVHGIYAVGQTVYVATNNGLSISTDGGKQFDTRSYSDGLGSDQVFGVFAQDNVVYAATNNGLGISTDGGLTFTNRTTANAGFGSNGIFGVYALGDTVYVATDNGLSISYDGGQSFNTNKTTDNGLGSNYVNRVYAVGQTVYAATSNGLSISTDGGKQFSTRHISDGLGSNHVNGVYTLGERLYVATEGGLSYCSSAPTLANMSANPNPVTAGQPTTFTATVGGVTGAYSYTLTNGVDTPLSGTASSPTFSQALTATGSGSQTYTLTVNSSGGVATAMTSLTVLTRPVTITDLSASPNPIVAGQSITFTATVANFGRGYAYALTNGRGSTRTGTADASSFSQTLTAQGSGVQTYTLTVTPFDEPTSGSATVDITVSPGPAVANGPACSNFINRSLPNDSPVTGVYAVGNTVYAATQNGLAISTDGGNSFPTIRTTASGLGANQVNAVYALGSTVYAATDGGLSISINGGQTFTNYTLGLSNNQARAVYVHGNTIYVATRGGLGVSNDGGQTFAIRTGVNGLGDILVNSVYAMDNIVYTATNNGLSISTNGGSSFAVNRTMANGLGSNVVLGVYAQGSTVYVATDNGLSISTDGGQTFVTRTTANGLGSNNVHAVYAVGRTVYAATNNGLSISTDEGQNFANYTPGNTDNGLGSNVVDGVHVAGDRIYTATQGGVSFCPRPVVAPTITALSASPNPVQAGQAVTFTATVGEVSGSYAYTLTNGVDTPLSGTANSSSFTQAPTASGSGLQTFTLTIAATSGTATANTSLTVLAASSGLTITDLRTNRNPLPASESLEFTATLAGLVDADIYSYTLTNGLETNPLRGDFHGPNFIESVEANGLGPQTYTLTVTSQKGDATASVSVIVTPARVGLEQFGILGVTDVGCETLSDNQRRLTFTPQYVGINGAPISFSVVNELAPTTRGGPYNLRLYTDNPVITLVASQGGVGEVRFIYHWLATCQGTPTPPQPPVSTGIPSQTLLQGQPFQLELTRYITDPDGQRPQFKVQGLPAGLSLNEGLIGGTPSTTGIYPVSLTATDPGGLFVTVDFTLTVVAASSSSSFALVGVSPVSCVQMNSIRQEYRVSFTPQYGGLTGQPISFSVVNELLPTTTSGPYTLQLYADNPVITLKATQAGSPSEASFSYNWRAACGTEPANPGSFGIEGVTTVNCESVGSGQRKLTFSPQYRGQDGSPISFSVVNELVATTSPGPYSLNLYTDNPIISLTAQQGAMVAIYRYDWLAACPAQPGGRLGTGGDYASGLYVRVLGNPIGGNELVTEVTGAEGLPLQYELIDSRGRVIKRHQVDQAGRVERQRLPIGNQPAGLLLLRVSAPMQSQTIKLVKEN